MDDGKRRPCYTAFIFFHSFFSKISGSSFARKANLVFDREWSRIMSILSDKTYAANTGYTMYAYAIPLLPLD